VAGDVRRVGILGAGYIADWHCSALRRMSGVSLAAVCDLSAGRAAQLAQRHRIPAHYADLDKMLAAESLDVVHVLLPPEHHAAAAERLLDAGAHVLLEKPMAIRAEECAALIERARKQGRALGVSHNFLFAPVYERLKADLAAGWLGRVDHVTITWNKELGQLRGGPFGGWMFRGPANIMLEVGPHSVAHMLDLVGTPDRLHAEADLPIMLPNGVGFLRRWLVRAFKDDTCVELRYGFGGGFPEHTIHVRGSAGIATVDFERITYTLRRHGAQAEDFDRYGMTAREGKGLVRQARRNLARYILSKFRLSRQGNAFGTSIARSLRCFYDGLPSPTDRRIAPEFGAEVVAACIQVAQTAGMEIAHGKAVRPQPIAPDTAPTVLVLGGTGFIGQALVRHLVKKGCSVRLLVRDPLNLPRALHGLPLDVVGGDIGNAADLDRALDGITHVFHLARAKVKTWDDYRRLEIGATRTVAEACLRRGVQRLLYTGTIDSYYSGDASQVIDEGTPLDPRIHRRNLYARAKAESEALLLEMRDKGLPLAVFRPGIVLGSGGSPFHWGVGFWPADSVCRLWGDGTHPLPLVLVDDVADALVRALDAEGVVGETFNLVGAPCLSARQYVTALEKAAEMKIDVRPRPAWRFYLTDMLKWVVKCLVRHPDRRLPSYRDWQTRAHRARFDCSKAKRVLGWQPAADPDTMIEEGIVKPVTEWLA
jgi:nucleoside-diphosphate-sugar epimerase/predicted dehydrogenase